MGLIPDEVFLGRISEVRTFAEGLAGDLKAELDITTDRIRSQIDGIGSSDTFNNFDASAIVGTIRRTQIEEGFASADELTLLESSLASAESRIDASILESSRVQSSESGAVARRVEVVRAQLGGFEASVASEASARATADGFLEGKYALTATAGNVVTGLNITSSTGAGTDISEISFQADKFQIFNGTTSSPVFDLDGSTIKLNAAVVVAGSITVSQLSDGGALAGQNSVDLNSGEVTNKSLANLDGAANTKLGGIAAGATVDAAWAGVTGRPVQLTDGRIATALNASGTVVSSASPTAAVGAPASGLHLGSDKMGYYDGSGWKTYMDNTGKFYLAGAGTNGLTWDGTDLSIIADQTTIGMQTDASEADSVLQVADRMSIFSYRPSGWAGVTIQMRAAGGTQAAPAAALAYTNIGYNGRAYTGSSWDDFGRVTHTLKNDASVNLASEFFTYTKNTSNQNNYLNFDDAGILTLTKSGAVPTLKSGRINIQGSSGSADGIYFNTDVNLFRESSDVLKTDDAFKCYSLETTGGGIRSDSSGGYGVMELAGPSGAFIDLSKDPEGDYDLRIMADGNPRIETDENNDLGLLPHGTGKLKFGTHAASADVAVSGYITIKDAGGTIRKLAVIS